MHRTAARERIKELRREAYEGLNKANRARKAGEELDLDDAFGLAAGLESDAARALHEAENLKDAARLQDLNLWKMEKEKNFKKGGIKKYEYWMASWREGSKVRNVHLGSCRKLDHGAALHKARELKAQALGISGEERETAA